MSWPLSTENASWLKLITPAWYGVTPGGSSALDSPGAPRSVVPFCCWPKFTAPNTDASSSSPTICSCEYGGFDAYWITEPEPDASSSAGPRTVTVMSALPTALRVGSGSGLVTCAKARKSMYGSTPLAGSKLTRACCTRNARL